MCPGRTPNSPSAPGAMTSMASTCTSRRSGVTTSTFRCAMALRRRQLLGLLDRHVDAADHVEGLLRQLVVLALGDLLEAANRLLQRHRLAGCPGEDLGDEERLREEPLHLARARDDQLVLV